MRQENSRHHFEMSWQPYAGLKTKAIYKGLFSAIFLLVLGTSIPAGGTEQDDALGGILSGRGGMDSYAEVKTISEKLLLVAGHNYMGKGIANVQAKFGSASAFRLTQGEGSPMAVCYAIDDYLIVFRAGAMGSWSEITGITFVKQELVSFARNCGNSATLRKWFAVNKKLLLSTSALANALRLERLPIDGLLATQGIVVNGIAMAKTTAVAYSQDGERLQWLDISEFIER